MTKSDIARWKNDEVTRHYFKILGDVRAEVEEQILEFTPNTPNFADQFFFLRGQLDGVKAAIEAELIEESEND